MPDVFIGLKEAATFEGVTYEALKKRVQRNPGQYKTRTQPQEGGGKEQVLIAVSSLSPKGRKAWRAAQKVDGRDVVIEKRTESAPWYVGVDLNHYTEQNKKAFYEAVELAARVQDFIDYDGPDRTAYAERYALGLGVSLPTLYRYVENVLKASAWALKMEKEDGQNRDYFRALALCRKPREKASFPSLTDEQKALIQNIWFDRRFAANLGTIEMLYEKFEEVGQGRGWESYPSIKTVARYIKHLMDSRGGESARYPDMDIHPSQLRPGHLRHRHQPRGQEHRFHVHLHRRRRGRGRRHSRREAQRRDPPHPQQRPEGRAAFHLHHFGKALRAGAQYGQQSRH